MTDVEKLPGSGNINNGKSGAKKEREREREREQKLQLIQIQVNFKFYLKSRGERRNAKIVLSDETVLSNKITRNTVE